MKKLLLVALAGILGACGSKMNKMDRNAELSEKRKTEVREALTALLMRDNADAFVIIEEPVSGKFVQFSGSVTEPLYFSLPTGQMNTDEFERAKTVLRAYRIKVSEVALFTDESATKPAGSLMEFNEKLGRDVEQGVALVSKVMTRVFGFKPAVPISLIES